MRSANIVKGLSVLALSSAVVAMDLSGKVDAATLGFDEVEGYYTYPSGSIPYSYGGFDWSGMDYLDGTIYPDSGYENGIVSGRYVAVIFGTSSVARVRNKKFTFNSAYLTSAENDTLITVEGYADNVLKYTKTISANTLTPQLVNFDFVGVDRLNFSSSNDLDFFAMDDFTYQVPEPGTILGTLLFGTVSGGAFWKKRKSQVKA